MKVYVVSEGSYSEHKILAVCSSKKIAAKIGDNVEEFEVLTSEPAWRMLHVATATISQSPHPTLWGDIYQKAHFHVGMPSDCSACNPGHVETGPCPGCKLMASRLSTHSWKLGPWDDQYPLAVSPPKAQVWHDGTITVLGGNKAEVAKRLEREVAKLLKGK